MGFEPTPVLKAIRTKCLDCSGGSYGEVADCLVKSCALYPFRMGKNPWRAELSAEQRAERAAHLRRPNAGENLPCHGNFGASDGEAATYADISAAATPTGRLRRMPLMKPCAQAR
jgi:hypothetical protein